MSGQLITVISLLIIIFGCLMAYHFMNFKYMLDMKYDFNCITSDDLKESKESIEKDKVVSKVQKEAKREEAEVQLNRPKQERKLVIFSSVPTLD